MNSEDNFLIFGAVKWESKSSSSDSRPISQVVQGWRPYRQWSQQWKSSSELSESPQIHWSVIICWLLSIKYTSGVYRQWFIVKCQNHPARNTQDSGNCTCIDSKCPVVLLLILFFTRPEIGQWRDTLWPVERYLVTCEDLCQNCEDYLQANT